MLLLEEMSVRVQAVQHFSTGSQVPVRLFHGLTYPTGACELLVALYPLQHLVLPAFFIPAFPVASNGDFNLHCPDE